MMRRKAQVRQRDDKDFLGASWRHVTADPTLVAGVEKTRVTERARSTLTFSPPRRRIRTTSFVGNAGIGSWSSSC